VSFAEGRERNWALGIFGAVGGSSASVGVIASGLLTDGPGWRWIFFINLPIGAALIALAARFLPADRPEVESRRFDALGAGTVTAGLLLLVYGLNRGVDHGWTNTTTMAIFVAAALLLAAFVRVEARSAAPLVPAAILRNRTMVASDLAAFLLFGAFFSFIFLASLLMQQLLAYSPTRTGLAWLATSITAFVAAGIAGAKLVSAVGVRRMLIVGLTLATLSMAWLTRVPPGADYVTDLLPALVLAGFAIGLSAPSVQIGALTGISGRMMGLASGLVETMREIGGAVGIAAASTVLAARTADANALADPVARQAAGFDAFQAAFTVTLAMAALGVIVAVVAFPRTRRGAPADSASLEPVPGALPVASVAAD
jgi:MFS family permease